MTTPEEAFFRQRRNLIAMSIIASFLNVAAVALNKLNILGNELEISNPKALPVALGIALFYFLVRYLQYMHDVEDKGFKKRFYSRVEKYLGPYLLRREFTDSNSRLARAGKDKKLSDWQVRDIIMFDDAMPSNTAAVTFWPANNGAIVEENNLRVSNKELILPFVRAGFYVTFRTRLVTDYILPLIVAAVAFATYIPRVGQITSHWL